MGSESSTDRPAPELDALRAQLREVDDATLYAMFLTHYRDLLSFFRNRDNLLFLDLQEPNLGEKVCEFLDLPPTDLRHVEISLRIM